MADAVKYNFDSCFTPVINSTEKLKRSKSVMLSQHIGRAMLGLQKLGKEFLRLLLSDPAALNAS
jgi:hypothetical protein